MNRGLRGWPRIKQKTVAAGRCFFIRGHPRHPRLRSRLILCFASCGEKLLTKKQVVAGEQYNEAQRRKTQENYRHRVLVDGDGDPRSLLLCRIPVVGHFEEKQPGCLAAGCRRHKKPVSGRLSVRERLIPLSDWHGFSFPDGSSAASCRCATRLRVSRATHFACE